MRRSGGERETPATDEQRERAVTGGDPACAYATRGRAPALRRPSLIDGRLIPVSTRAGTCYRVPTYISLPPTRNPVCAESRREVCSRPSALLIDFQHSL